MKAGWGMRHPAVAEVLAHLDPIATEETAWANGTIPLRVAAHLPPTTVPDELILSVRCLVTVAHQIVVCTTVDGSNHPWPGGRRERGETFQETACREVAEETGWIVDIRSLRQVGWLHIEHLSPQPDDWPFPHPDFFQIVYAAQAADRLVSPGEEWSDIEGYEVTSRLMLPADVAAMFASEPITLAFLGRIGLG